MKNIDLSKIERDGIYFKSTDISNMFLIEDTDDIKSYNITSTIHFTNTDMMSSSLYDTYVTKTNDQWTLISHHFYGSVDLWWFVCKFNNIVDPSEVIPSGKILKIPIKSLMVSLTKGI